MGDGGYHENQGFSWYSDAIFTSEEKKGGRSRLNPGKSFDINNDEDKTVEYASSNWNTRGGTFGCEFVYCEGWSAIFETTL